MSYFGKAEVDRHQKKKKKVSVKARQAGDSEGGWEGAVS